MAPDPSVGPTIASDRTHSDGGPRGVSPTTQPSASTEFETTAEERERWKREVGADVNALLRDLDLAVRQRDEERERADEGWHIAALRTDEMNRQLMRAEQAESDIPPLQCALATARTEAVNETVREIVEFMRKRANLIAAMNTPPSSGMTGAVHAIHDLAQVIERRVFHKKTGEAGE